MQCRQWVLRGSLAIAVAALVAVASGRALADEREQAKIELGRRLFFDPAVSRAGTVACAECHDPEHGFSDPRRFSLDETGRTRRHSQPLVDLGGEGFHWDGEFRTPRELIVARVGTAAEARQLAWERFREHREAFTASGADPDRAIPLTTGYYGPDQRRRSGSPSAAVVAMSTPVAARLDHDDRYDAALEAAFGSDAVLPARIIDALDAFLGSLRSTESPYDRFAAGEVDALDESARRGYRLFRAPAGCVTCHQLDHGRTISDGLFHNTGVAFVEPRQSTDVDVGRGGITGQDGHRSAFKTPNLRDVALRPPYMHDGSFATLYDVVRYYSDGGTPNHKLDPAIRPLDLTAGQVADLVAFLRSLTGVERAGLAQVSPDRTKRQRVRIVGVGGKPFPNLLVTIRPAGDRFRGTRPADAPTTARTDADGWIEFGFPQRTHVTLHAEDMEIGLGRPIHDLRAGPLTLAATPLRDVAVRVHWLSKRVPLPESLLFKQIGAVTDSYRRHGTVTFRRVRRVGTDVGVFVAHAESGAGPTILRLVAVDGRFYSKNRELGIGASRLIDLGGGASAPIHLAGEHPGR